MTRLSHLASWTWYQFHKVRFEPKFEIKLISLLKMMRAKWHTA